MPPYLSEISANRNLIIALSRLELIARYRRSFLGILWALIIPLSMTVLISIVLQKFFNQSFRAYSYHVFTGLVVWDFFVQCVLTAAGSIVGAHNIMSQVKLPSAVFSLKTFISLFVAYLIGLSGCVAWVFLLDPERISLIALLIIPNSVVIAACLLPVALVSSVLGLLFRDFSQGMQIVIQGLWFATPVFFLKSLFTGPLLSWWDLFNPVSNLLDLIRAPLVHGEFPNTFDYLVPICYAIVVLVCYFLLVRKYERQMVFYV